MSARKKPTPKPRGRAGGRKPKYGVKLTTSSIQMLPAAWELLDEQRGDVPRGEYVMRLLGVELPALVEEQQS